MVLGLDPSEAGLGATEALPRAYGVVMDTVYPNGAATLAALADGTTSLYLSSGGGTIGGGEHADIAAATHRLVALAESAVDQIPVVADDGLPPEGSMRPTSRATPASGRTAAFSSLPGAFECRGYSLTRIAM